jgi:primosomal protein N' (replication factor Y) (superfamily II helicase)
VRIKQKESFVIIGSRSALFSPFQDLGLVILDEEHEWTYKSDQTPRYHAKEVAKHIAHILHIPIILGSATPDVESYKKAQEGDYVLLTLPDKITL